MTPERLKEILEKFDVHRLLSSETAREGAIDSGAKINSRVETTGIEYGACAEEKFPHPFPEERKDP